MIAILLIAFVVMVVLAVGGAACAARTVNRVDAAARKLTDNELKWKAEVTAEEEGTEP